MSHKQAGRWFGSKVGSSSWSTHNFRHPKQQTIQVWRLYMCIHIAIVLPCVANPVIGALLGGEPSPCEASASPACGQARRVPQRRQNCTSRLKGLPQDQHTWRRRRRFSGKATWGGLVVFGWYQYGVCHLLRSNFRVENDVQNPWIVGVQGADWPHETWDIR